MKANELMVGDLILVNGRPTRVYGIMERQGRIYDTMTNDISLKRCEPMPLTSEILEKNGFTRFGTDYILKERHFGLENPSTPSNYFDNYWLRVSIKAVHIEFVHELQHALRLCGIEKNIEI